VRPDLRHGVLGRVPGHGGGAEGGDEGGNEVHGVGGVDAEDGGGGIEAGWVGVGEVGREGEIVRLDDWEGESGSGGRWEEGVKEEGEKVELRGDHGRWVKLVYRCKNGQTKGWKI